ncbi:MAG: bacteriohemerythrin [Bacteroidetes bacterium]|nr:bacteriohemerythrin [Bacteroidota bacterium]
MNLIEQSAELETSDPLMDSQHTEFVEIINLLYRSMSAIDKEIEIELMRNLLDSLKTHFDYEESMMKEKKYVNYFSHKLDHDQFCKKISDFNEKIIDGTQRVNLEILNSLKNWFVNHLELNDKKLGKFLAEVKLK